jgi:hypothetical protein
MLAAEGFELVFRTLHIMAGDRVGSFGDWLDTTFGLVLTIGGLAATAAFFAGLLGIPPNLKRLNELGAQVEAAGGTPTPEQATQLARIQVRMRRCP